MVGKERYDTASGPPDDFKKRLDRAREAARVREGAPARRRSAYDFGIRVATEMAVAVAVGFGLGWYLDKWLGTTPWLLLLFLPLGATAGILNVMRAAKVEAERQQAELLRTNLDDTNRDESGKR